MYCKDFETTFVLEIWQKLLLKFQNSKRVYITSTPLDVKEKSHFISS